MASTSRQTIDTTTASEQKQLDDINMKIRVAKDIVDACEVEKNLQGLMFPIDEEAKRFAGYVGSKYEKLFYDHHIQSSAMKIRTLKVMLLENGNNNHYTYMNVREVVFDIYVNKRMLPTKSMLRTALVEMGYATFNNTDILSRALKFNGFVWTPLPNLKKAILVEKPELVRSRFQYLKQMAKHRSDNRDIVYLEEGNYMTDNVSYQLQPTNIFVIAASKNGVIDIDFVPVLKNHNDYLKKFIEKIGHLLPSRCVLVLNERQHHVRKTVPTEYSSRKEMIDWLKDSKIPFEETMHSSELFALTQRYKNNYPAVRFRFEDVVKKFDAEVVYKPYIMSLNLFQNVDIVTKRYHKRCKNSLLELKTMNIDWKGLEDDMIATERRLFEDDMKMEVIIDKLMTMASDGKICSDWDDIKQLPDSKYDCTDSNILSNIVIL